MDFTFGIITDGKNDNYLNIIIDSIKNNNIPNYEIIIVGNTKIISSKLIKILYFDEHIKTNWITKKKNIIVQNAKFENIVLLHDYIKFDNNWYNGFLLFGNNFDWCITKIFNNNGQRFRDYTLFPSKVNYLNINYSPGDFDKYFDNNCLLPYNFENNIKTNKYMYISGSYYIIKKKIALQYLLDENLVWGQGEDVEYSKRLNENGIIIKCNKHSSITLLKQKNHAPWEKEITTEYLNKFIEYCNT
jgi:hypothetical protein